MDITSVQHQGRHKISLYQVHYLPDTLSIGSSSVMIQKCDLTSVTKKQSKATTSADIKAYCQPK